MPKHSVSERQRKAKNCCTPVKYGLPEMPRQWRLRAEYAYPGMAKATRRVLHAIERRYEDGMTFTPLGVLCRLADVSEQEARDALAWLVKYGFISLYAERSMADDNEVLPRIHLHAKMPDTERGSRLFPVDWKVLNAL